MTVRTATRADLGRVLDWAAAEGWNPGLDDADAFFAADPEGFFVNDVAGRIVAAVSVVNHSDSFAFLGLYLCLPEFRGQGLGMQVWAAALAHAGGRTVGLDGVPAQQANYARSGFVRTGRTVRFQGAGGQGSGAVPADPVAARAMDARACGVQRPSFAAAWFADTATRRTLALPSGDFATFRACREGVKIGPIHAATPGAARALLASVPADFAPGPLYIDVPDTAPALIELLGDRGFAPGFETARMYAGPPPAADPPPFHAIATMELG